MPYLNLLIAFIIGVIATLIAGNPLIRFHFERVVRRLFGKPLISVALINFTTNCEDGMFVVHCVELKNKMWLTTEIPRVYLLRTGFPSGLDRTFRPLLYHREQGMSQSRFDCTLSQVLNEYGNKIFLFEPDNQNLVISVSRNARKRVAIIVETIANDIIDTSTALNSQHPVGELYATICNPMPRVIPGDQWGLSIISETYGHIDFFDISIPENLADIESLGDSLEAMKMVNRPPCFLDIEPTKLTWPLRFSINDCAILVRNTHPKNILVYNTKKPSIGIKYLLFRAKLNMLKTIHYLKLQILFGNLKIHRIEFELKLRRRKLLYPLAIVFRLLYFLMVLPFILVAFLVRSLVSLITKLIKLVFYHGPSYLFSILIRLLLKTEFGRRFFYKRFNPYPPKIQIQ
ncbi:MAG: hypothetical protein GY861_12915 [bacterium]|nr:hypothetical protein [bacterium]